MITLGGKELHTNFTASVARLFYSFAQLFIQKSTVFARIAQYLRNMECYVVYFFINEQIDGKFKGPIMEERSGLNGHWP